MAIDRAAGCHLVNGGCVVACCWQEGLEISHHADNTLKSFCKWQATINPGDDSHPNHHDVAILLTR